MSSNIMKLNSKSDLKNICLRSCEHEIIEPIEGVVSGEIPSWINGSLLRNGPGSIKVGDMIFNHLFDASALLHRFNIADGKVTYQCRFLKSETYKKNLAANRIVVSEFGTSSVPDPCQSIFQKISAIFHLSEMASDNALISIYPINDKFYTFVEFPVIHQINPTTLETENTVKVLKYVKGLVYHTSHPHVMPDGTVFNLGLSVSLTGPKYKIFSLKKGEKCFENAEIVAEVPVRWKFNPGYMHTFGVTENFFIIVEQPLTISVAVKLKKIFKKTTVSELMKWSPKENCRFCLVNRQTGKVEYEFESKAFPYFHIINQYEKDNHIVIDICCLSDASVLNKLYLESIKELEKESDLLKITLAKPFRFVLPLCNVKSLTCSENENLVTLPNTKASAYLKLSNGNVFCVPELLSESRCELPRINYENYLGKEYKFVYGVSFEKDNSNSLIKIDVVNKTSTLWTESNCYPSEPIFVPSPNAKSEDDGILLAALLWGGNDEKRVGLLVLNAVTMKELGRCEFSNLPSPAPKCFHGWFAR